MRVNLMYVNVRKALLFPDKLRGEGCDIGGGDERRGNVVPTHIRHLLQQTSVRSLLRKNVESLVLKLRNGTGVSQDAVRSKH